VTFFQSALTGDIFPIDGLSLQAGFPLGRELQDDPADDRRRKTAPPQLSGQPAFEGRPVQAGQAPEPSAREIPRHRVLILARVSRFSQGRLNKFLRHALFPQFLAQAGQTEALGAAALADPLAGESGVVHEADPAEP
jgi:hypothetical protein